jgi:hypothetical protein
MQIFPDDGRATILGAEEGLAEERTRTLTEEGIARDTGTLWVGESRLAGDHRFAPGPTICRNISWWVPPTSYFTQQHLYVIVKPV